MDWPQQIMIFIIDNEQYGFPLHYLERVVLAQMITVRNINVNLPSLYGVSAIDNAPISLIDMRILFQKVVVEDTSETSILLTKLKDVDVGFKCDNVKSVVKSEKPLHPLPVPLLMEARDYFAGVFLHDGEMVVVVNPETLFREGDLEVIRKVTSDFREIIESGYTDKSTGDFTDDTEYSENDGYSDHSIYR